MSLGFVRERFFPWNPQNSGTASTHQQLLENHLRVLFLHYQFGHYSMLYRLHNTTFTLVLGSKREPPLACAMLCFQSGRFRVCMLVVYWLFTGFAIVNHGRLSP